MKTAKLFLNGQSQAVRLPKEFRMKGNEVYIKKIGNSVMLIPKNHPWESLLNSLQHFSADLVIERNQPKAQQKRDDLFS